MARAGRPCKFEVGMNKKVIALMNEGASIAEVARELGISKDTLNEWCREDGDYYIKGFSDAVKLGKSLSQGWWEKMGRINLIGDKDKPFNQGLWMNNMKNRFRGDWADRHEVTGAEGQAIYPAKIEILPPIKPKPIDIEDKKE